MDNKLFVAEVLDHTYIGLYHELIVSAQHVQMTRGFSMHSNEQVAQFAIDQAQATIETLGYVRIPSKKLESINFVRDTILKDEKEFTHKAAEYLLESIEELGLDLSHNNIWSTHRSLCKKSKL